MLPHRVCVLAQEMLPAFCSRQAVAVQPAHRSINVTYPIHGVRRCFASVQAKGLRLTPPLSPFPPLHTPGGILTSFHLGTFGASYNYDETPCIAGSAASAAASSDVLTAVYSAPELYEAAFGHRDFVREVRESRV